MMNKVYKNEESNLHKGHRKRLKDKYIALGTEGLTDAEMLELILFYALPQRDTAPLAKALLDRYGSVSAILDTPRERLMELDGINEHSALFLSLLTEVGKLYRMDKLDEDNLFEDKEKIARYLMAMLCTERRERTAMLCFDRQRRLLSAEIIFDEDVGQMTSAHIRKVASRALGVGAHAIALAHNHESGISEPSENDISATNALDVALGGVEIHLVENFVVTDDKFVGIKEFIIENGYENA